MHADIAASGMSAMKSTVLAIAAGTGVFTLSRRMTRNAARILAYHGVDDRADPALNFDGFHVHPDVFEQHLRTLAGHYHVVTLRSLAECFRDGRAPPRGAVAITFDDGYRNNLTHAVPLLRKYNLPATFFITTGFIDGTHQPWWFRLRAAGGVDVVTREAQFKRLASAERERAMQSEGIPPALPYPMLDWDGLRQILAAGHDVGAHTVSHVSLAHESAETVAGEVHDSVARIAEMTGQAPVLYAYPYGEAAHFTSEIIRPVRAAGCIGGVTTVEGLNGAGTDPFLMRRFNVTGNHDRNAFRALVSGLRTVLGHR